MAGERVATYEYDGLFRRVEKTVGNQGSGPVYQSNVNMTGIEAGNRHEHFYYSGWRLMEMQDDATPSNRTLNQFAYGTQYIDEPVVYDRNTDVSSDDDCLEAAGSQRYTYHQDANYRVVLLTAEDGTVVERYQYTAYGEPTVYAGYSSQAGAELGNALPVSSVGNPFMHQGLFHDAETGTHQNRFRQLDSRDGRFMQRDPRGMRLGHRLGTTRFGASLLSDEFRSNGQYADGANLYEYLGSGVLARADAPGLGWVCCVFETWVKAPRGRGPSGEPIPDYPQTSYDWVHCPYQTTGHHAVQGCRDKCCREHGAARGALERLCGDLPPEAGIHPGGITPPPPPEQLPFGVCLRECLDDAGCPWPGGTVVAAISGAAGGWAQILQLPAVVRYAGLYGWYCAHSVIGCAIGCTVDLIGP